MRIGLVLLSGALVAGCSAGQSNEQALLQHGYSANYVAGYRDGCRSGKRAAGDGLQPNARKQSAYAAAGDYKTGWDYGYLTCRQTEAENEVIYGAIGKVIADGIAKDHGADGVDARKVLQGIDTSGLEGVEWDSVAP